MPSRLSVFWMNVQHRSPAARRLQPIPALELLWSLPAGLPSPVDVDGKRIDHAARLIKHPQATFLMRARGDSISHPWIVFRRALPLLGASLPQTSGLAPHVEEAQRTG